MTTSTKHVLSGFLSFVAVLVASAISALTREILQSKNTLDTGVGLYSHGSLANLAGFLAFVVVLLGSLYAIRRTLSPAQKQLPYMVAVLTCTCLSPFLAVALLF